MNPFVYNFTNDTSIMEEKCPGKCMMNRYFIEQVIQARGLSNFEHIFYGAISVHDISFLRLYSIYWIMNYNLVMQSIIPFYEYYTSLIDSNGSQ